MIQKINNHKTKTNMITKYSNVDVLVDDPMGLFKENKEMEVRMKYIPETNTFEVTVPERKEKEVDTTPKPKPLAVYEDSVAKVKGTITVKEHLKVGIDLAADKAMELGRDRLKESLDKALDVTYDECQKRNNA